ncbi:MAG: glutaredoxin [Pseudomonadota bacterium]
MVNNPKAPVVMFGFEWCEFCWSVRRLFDQAGIPFKSIDVDSMDYRFNDWGGDVLRALFDRTGMRTVPQIFVGGSLVGGASDVLASFGIGTLQNLLAELPKPIETKPVEDPMQFLPIWVKRTASVSSATAQSREAR